MAEWDHLDFFVLHKQKVIRIKLINKEISYFLTDNLPLVFKLHEICSVFLTKNHENCCHQN